MPLKSKKSPAKRKPQPKAKVSRPKKVVSIFRQILQDKERKKEQSPPQPYRSSQKGYQLPQRHEQFAKFAGPRRRAA